ncbi:MULTISPECIES: threonine ammonia-lyase [unclassified Sphingomonas]|uniref:threonine ammonia-lyase n=1 Tax=unclassified Sphingomonas TaxID=196159 RepID=UPI0006FE83F2|nr:MULTISPECIES: pyridoxal-phosphate dependent enzyme [unclassified Sphingomonas]KQX18329.1 pyridoxal-5'-phosphate-dependent protein subunit beta [Sphingomonas sp. Root1294]KQY72344.1 pyridoxal-5'-phosphate-dependent protein subunit beta [Sphingomonas sp. Root50]KRB94383.1 pyridoxal-5'-phosphate-dependent protein subunit beta [Sphingomonas sp. Root720]
MALDTPLLPDADAIEAAARRISDLAIRSPLIRLQGDGRNDIFLKLEMLQPVGSFKIRCAANALLQRVEAGHVSVSTASAGNFAQGLAYAGRERGIAVTAYVPESAAESKLAALRRMDATIVRLAYADWWSMLADGSDDPAFIHPVADRDVIAGNATIGFEIAEDLPGTATVVIPYGGGGLTTGVATGLKARGSTAMIVACETEAGAPLRGAFAAGKPVTVPFDSGSFVTGMGGPAVIPAMWPHVRALVDDAALVSLAETAAAVKLLAERHHLIAEGAGAAPVAAAIARADPGPVVCIVSGGHLDPGHLAAILAGAVP